MQTSRLDDSKQTIVVAVEGTMAFVAYWGALLPGHENLNQLVAAQVRDVTGGMMDKQALVSLCPVEGDAFPGQPALLASDVKGVALMPNFVLQDVYHHHQLLKLT